MIFLVIIISFKFKFLGFCVCEFITCLFLDFMICRFEPLWTSWLRDTWQINQVWNLDVSDDRLAVNLELCHTRCREVCPSWFLSSHDILAVQNTRRWHQSNSLQSPTRMLYRDWRETALARISQYDSDRWASYNFSQHLVVLCDFKCILFWIMVKVPFSGWQKPPSYWKLGALQCYRQAHYDDRHMFQLKKSIIFRTGALIYIRLYF